MLLLPLPLRRWSRRCAEACRERGSGGSGSGGGGGAGWRREPGAGLAELDVPRPRGATSGLRRVGTPGAAEPHESAAHGGNFRRPGHLPPSGSSVVPRLWLWRRLPELGFPAAPAPAPASAAAPAAATTAAAASSLSASSTRLRCALGEGGGRAVGECMYVSV
ncbi:uncharacterized protein LOC144458194 [Phascolarctos cinereus]